MPAGNTALLAVKIIGDSSGATQALSAVETATGRTAGVTTSAGRDMTGVWTAVAAAMTGCAKAASDLEQATGAVTQIFGEQAPEMMAFAESMQAYGLSTAQAAQMSAVMGAQLKNLGIPMEHVAELTQALIMLGADLAAVMGGTVPQACAALGAALRGEFDTLEQYGITINAAAVEAEALALAESGVTFASESQAKAVATLSLIWEQTTDVQGAAAEETDTLAASMGALRAAVTNLAAQIGGALIPILVPLIQTITDVIVKVSTWIEESELLQIILDAVSVATEFFSSVLDALRPLLQVIADLVGALGDILARVLQPALDAIARALDIVSNALDTIIGWVEKAIDAFERFIDVVHEAIDSLTFWNDKYESSAPPTAFAMPPQRVSRSRVTRAPSSGAAAGGGGVTVYTMFGDPHSIAREIRRLLREDAARLGVS